MLIAVSIATLNEEGKPEGVVLDKTGVSVFAGLLQDPENYFIGHNLPFDIAVISRAMPELQVPFLKALRDGRCSDTIIREKLKAIAQGRDLVTVDLSLKGLAEQYLGLDLEKSTVRTTYTDVEHLPVTEWPEKYVTYARLDAETTLAVYLAQGQGLVSPDEHMQVCAAYDLHLAALKGLNLDAAMVHRAGVRLADDIEKYGRLLHRAGVLSYVGKKNPVLKKSNTYVKSLIEQHFAEKGVEPPRTEKGAIKTGVEVLSQIVSEVEAAEVCDGSSEDFDAILSVSPIVAGIAPLVAYERARKDLSTYLQPMLDAVNEGIRMPSRPNVLVATGRTSWSSMTLGKNGPRIGVNVQNWPRKPGVRDCVVAAPGYVLCSVDYNSLELRTLAQTLLSKYGRSTLAAAYQQDPDHDPHTAFAAKMIGVSYQEGLKLAKSDPSFRKGPRQRAKAATFGFPGGLGIEKFQLLAKLQYGLVLTVQEVRDLKAAWLRENPEMVLYFRDLSNQLHLAEAYGKDGIEIKLPISGRVRGGCGYTDGANYGFQGPAADGAKAALADVTWACYADQASPLYGSAPVAFIHDEIIVEVPEETAHECAFEIVRLMEAAMEKAATPDVPSRATPALSFHWIKAAEDFYVDGRLTPWEYSPKGQEYVQKLGLL